MNNYDNFLKKTNVPKSLLALNIILALVYFAMIAFFFERGNMILFGLLIAGEIFHIWQSFTFIYTIWETEHRRPHNPSFTPPVDVFIPVAGEPLEVIEQTVRAAQTMDYPYVRVHVLNDGYVAKKANWQEVERLVEDLGAHCITRKTPGGAKAGNINNALRATNNPFIAFFDADHVPRKDFLRKTMPYFVDARLAFVQTPQFYKNHDTNFVTQGAWEQQALFFGPICKGKNRLNSVSMCGTNMVIRREALLEVGGMCETSIAEDFVTGFMLHKNGWRSFYVAEILAEGLAPEDFLSYFKQQMRWARGSLDLIFRHNLLFTRGVNRKQQVQYLSSVSYFLSGWVVFIDALIPIVFFFTGLFPFKTSTMALATVFLPYILITIYLIQRACNFSFSYRALAFSIAGFNIHMTSSIKSLFRVKSSFSVTSKKALKGNFLHLVMPQILYIPLVAAGAMYSFLEHGITPSWVTNLTWGIINSIVFGELIKGAAPRKAPKVATEAERLPVPAWNEVASSRKR